MNELVLNFDSTGNAHCLYSELIDLASIGPLEISRASTVEFNSKTQKWEVRLTGSRTSAFASPSRKACLEWEINTLNQRL